MTSSDLFECTMCGDCCNGYGGTFLTPADIISISEFVTMDPIQFQEVYCVRSGGKPILAQGNDGYCIFWDQTCRIHPVKPEMCRAWPFIEAILKDVDTWYAMADSCPGMRRDATRLEILECVKEELKRLKEQ